MRIVHTGVFVAALMKPISGGGFWIGIFSLIMLIPIVYGNGKLMRYIRLKRRGVKVYARITKSEKVWRRSGRAWMTVYSYDTENGGYGGCGRFEVSFRTKKYRPGGKLEIRYNRDDPYDHIIVPDSLWEVIGLLFVAGLIFVAALLVFIIEVRKMFV